MRRAVLLAGLLALPLALPGCLGNDLVGRPAPPFELTLQDGSVVNETTHLGRYVVLDLMATWCGPCKLEVAHLREIQRAYGDEVVILSVGVDAKESMADLDAFAREHGATWDHGKDWNGSIARAYGLRIIPRLVVIGPDGTVLLAREGEVPPAVIARVLDPAAVPAAASPWPLAAAGLGLGFLAWFNPYRRFHREGNDPRAGALALAGVAALAGLAWSFAGFVGSRATYASLLVGALALAAAAGWSWARHRRPRPKPAAWWLEAGDRLYELAPHLLLVVVLGLRSVGAFGFALATIGFAGGVGGAMLTARDVPPRLRAPLGVAGLALAGIGLLAYGLRLVVAR